MDNEGDSLTSRHKMALNVKNQPSQIYHTLCIFQTSLVPSHLQQLYLYPNNTENNDLPAPITSLTSTTLSPSSSSSYRAGSTDIPDPLSPLLPIVHRPRQVFRTTTCILT